MLSAYTHRWCGVHALVHPHDDQTNVDACGYCMLQRHELQAGMRFLASSVVLGTHEEQPKQLRHAATPPVMAWLVTFVLATLG